MKHKILFTGWILFAALALGACSLLAKQQALAEKMIRFHVVANSDSEGDQQNKLAVRDALLEDIADMAASSTGREDMEKKIQASLPVLRQKAEKTLQNLHCNMPVAVSLRQEAFPTRYYPTFTLPAGSYLSLRVQLGQGQGHNWWCVCFPSLCTSACAGDLEEIAASAGFSQDEVDWITNEEDYVLRFKVLEWVQRIKSHLDSMH